MMNELDPDLTRLFAQARAPLAGDVFMSGVLLNMERVRRARMRRQVLAVAAVAVVVLLNLGPVLEDTAAVVRLVGDIPPASADLLVTPWGWAVSMLVGIVVVLRARPSRR